MCLRLVAFGHQIKIDLLCAAFFLDEALDIRFKVSGFRIRVKLRQHALREALGSSVEALGCPGELWGTCGKLWEAVGSYGEALGNSGEALG